MIGGQPAPFRLVERRLHIRKPKRGGIRLARGPEPVKPVRRARLLGGGWPVRDDAKLGINLHGIGVDDDAAQLARQLQRKRRLAARRRPADQHRSCVVCLVHSSFAILSCRNRLSRYPASQKQKIADSRKRLPR